MIYVICHTLRLWRGRCSLNLWKTDLERRHLYWLTWCSRLEYKQDMQYLRTLIWFLVGWQWLWVNKQENVAGIMSASILLGQARRGLRRCEVKHCTLQGHRCPLVRRGDYLKLPSFSTLVDRISGLCTVVLSPPVYRSIYPSGLPQRLYWMNSCIVHTIYIKLYYSISIIWRANVCFRHTRLCRSFLQYISAFFCCH